MGLEETVNEASKQLIETLKLFYTDRAYTLMGLLKIKNILKQALVRDPDNTQANHNLAEILVYQGINDFENTCFDKTIELCESALQHYELAIQKMQNASRPKVAGESYVEHSDYKDYFTLKASLLGKAYALKMISASYKAKGDKQRYIEYLHKAEVTYIEFFKGPADSENVFAALIDLGNIQSLLGKFNAAEYTYKKIVSIAGPENPYGQKAQRELRVMQTRREKGIQD